MSFSYLSVLNKLKAAVGNIDCFDISKHITGSLRQRDGMCSSECDFNYT
jgi:hypothetical protein